MATTPQTIRADSDRRFYLRFLLIGLVVLGFSLWSLYDGAIAWPHQRERGLEYQKLEEEGRLEEWPEIARQRGWSDDPPGEPRSEVDIQGQYIMAAVTGAIGLALLLVVWRSRGRWIEADESAITSSWGQRVEYSAVQALEKRRWRSKGIAKVRYHDGRRARTFVLDNYKFHQHPTNAILYRLESHLDPEKIIGGPPDPPPDESPHDEIPEAAEAAEAATEKPNGAG